MRSIRLALGILLAAGGCSSHNLGADGAGADGPGAGADGPASGGKDLSAPPAAPIEHIIFFIKENRTFDNYFGTFPGADGVTMATASDGKMYPLKHQSDSIPADISHASKEALLAYDNGKMDKFDKIQSANTGQPFPYTNLSLTQFVKDDLPNYWAYAQEYVLGDHMFSALLGPSFPNHLYTIAAQSGGATDNPGMTNVGGNGWGRDQKGQMVQVKGPDGGVSQRSSCFDFATLADELDKKGLSWRYYAPQSGQSGYIWSSFNAIQHIRYGKDWQYVVPVDQFSADAQAGKLATVSWIVTPSMYSEHPPPAYASARAGR